jgi:MFS family permease
VSDTLAMPITFLGMSIQKAETATSVFMLFILIGSSVAGWPIGKLADKFSRKWLAFSTLVLQALASGIICTKRSFNLDIFCAFLYGK